MSSYPPYFSAVLQLAMRLMAKWQSITVLLLMVHVVRACMDDRLSVQIIICLFSMVVRLLHVSLIAVSSAWNTLQ